jgi:Gas vesicle synthesis protein GvpO
MAESTRGPTAEDVGGEPLLTAREVADLAREYIAEMTELEPVMMTSLAPTDDGGWAIEVEVVEAQRIPSSSDILALYEILLDAGGELLSYRRVRRYLRGRTTEGAGQI